MVRVVGANPGRFQNQKEVVSAHFRSKTWLLFAVSRIVQTVDLFGGSPNSSQSSSSNFNPAYCTCTDTSADATWPSTHVPTLASRLVATSAHLARKRASSAINVRSTVSEMGTTSQRRSIHVQSRAANEIAELSLGDRTCLNTTDGHMV